MPYTPTVWTNASTPVSATNQNHLETQFAQAVNSFNQDLFTPFVESGLVCTPDGTTLNQLDVTAGVSYLIQAGGNNELYRTATAASVANQFLTSVINTTYYLFLLVGGTFQWGTTSTGPANSLAICQASTNSSGNISAVTDKRPLNTTLLPNMVGSLNALFASAFNATGAANSSYFHVAIPSTTTDQNGILDWADNTTGAIHWQVGKQAHVNGDNWRVLDATNAKVSLALAPNGGGITTLANQATVGTFGAAVIVAQAINVSVTATGVQTILSYAPPATGFYRVNVAIDMGNLTPEKIDCHVKYSSPNLGNPFNYFYDSTSAQIFNGSQATATANTTIGCSPIVIYAKTGANNIIIEYNDPAGTPADHVTAMIERLA